MKSLDVVRKIREIKEKLAAASDHCKTVRIYKENVQAMHDNSKWAEENIASAMKELTALEDEVIGK